MLDTQVIIGRNDTMSPRSDEVDFRVPQRISLVDLY